MCGWGAEYQLGMLCAGGGYVGYWESGEWSWVDICKFPECPLNLYYHLAAVPLYHLQPPIYPLWTIVLLK